jgi:caffeoyl-CoA O-methyltransferase
MARDQIFLNDALYDYMLAVSDREPAILARLREETRPMKLGFWQIPANQGQFLAVLVKCCGARQILEIGTFTGYSSLAMARALPADGRMVCCDISEEFTAIARRYWDEAGVSDKIELRLAPGADSMDALIAEGRSASFDLVFIDANKNDYETYYEKALVLVRTGGLIVVDNTLFGGRVVGQNLEGLAQWQLDWTEDVKRFNAARRDDTRVSLAMIAVGDGMTLCVKN